jgi:hypothetical protein
MLQGCFVLIIQLTSLPELLNVVELDCSGNQLGFFTTLF